MPVLKVIRLIAKKVFNYFALKKAWLLVVGLLKINFRSFLDCSLVIPVLVEDLFFYQHNGLEVSEVVLLLRQVTNAFFADRIPNISELCVHIIARKYHNLKPLVVIIVFDALKFNFIA